MYAFSISSLPFFLIFCQTISGTIVKRASDDIVLVHVVFRHGQRTIEAKSIYPNDPYKNEEYYPYGLAQLTNKGKLQAYELGQCIGQRYDDFLGELYLPGILHAQTTDVDRTKMSLMLVLAGLFPPIDELVWNPELKWQPIPYHYTPVINDEILLGVFCPKYQKLYEEYISTQAIQDEFQKYNETFAYLSEHAGSNFSTFFQAYGLYFGLLSEEEWGFPLPEWTKKVFPEELEKLTIKEYETRTGTTQLRQYLVGNFLKKIINDTRAKIENTLEPKNRKLFLYSGHEYNIASMLITLGIFEPHIPPYASAIFFEVHLHDGVYGFMIYYEDYTKSSPKLLKIPSCTEFCPFDQFEKLLEEYFPPDDYYCQKIE